MAIEKDGEMNFRKLSVRSVIPWGQSVNAQHYEKKKKKIIFVNLIRRNRRWDKNILQVSLSM